METFKLAREIASCYPGLAALSLILIVTGIAYNLRVKPHGSWRKLPPGPRGIPLMGNVREMLGERWLTLTALKEKYGPVMHLSVAGQCIIVLNTLKAAADLLDRKAVVSSNRPRSITVAIMTGGMMMPFLNPGHVWNRMRRASQDGLRPGNVPLFQPGQYREAVILCISMLTECRGAEWYGHIQRAVAASSIKLIYGKEATDQDVKTLNLYVERLTRSAKPGAHLVEIIPWMRHIPSWLSPWRRRAEQAFATDSATFRRLFNESCVLMKQDTKSPSVVGSLADRSKWQDLEDEEASWLAAAVYTGAQTMVGILSWWLMAMVLYPEAQQCAHDELDRVVGRDRLPTLEDCENMPYLQATVREIIRWRPIDPLGLPHTTSDDIWHEGYFIPKGSMLVPNVWAINRDADTFGPDAHHFNPARHLDAETGKLKPAPADTKEEGHVSFGFGRRICVGRHLANKMLLINIVVLTWAMNIDGEHGPNGECIGLDVDGCIDEGIVVRPIPFPCSLTPRFPHALSLLQKAL